MKSGCRRCVYRISNIRAVFLVHIAIITHAGRPLRLTASSGPLAAISIWHLSESTSSRPTDSATARFLPTTINEGAGKFN